MKIPKLAKGGIINNDSAFIGEGKGKPVVPLKDKYYEIYKRTKNKRIKKKQLKKSWKLQWFNSPVFKEINDMFSKMDKVEINVGGRTIVKHTKNGV